jgi:type II secretory pathway pseudopilin PulG
MLFLSKKGFSLLEALLLLSITIFMLSVIMSAFKQRAERGWIEQTVNDMIAIADATQNYNSTTGSWPTSIADLTPTYLPGAVSQNAFGNPFILLCTAGTITVSSKVPAGLALNTALGPLFQVSSVGGGVDIISITKREQVGPLGRLKYDKKYLFHE